MRKDIPWFAGEFLMSLANQMLLVVVVGSLVVLVCWAFSSIRLFLVLKEFGSVSLTGCILFHEVWSPLGLNLNSKQFSPTQILEACLGI